jgi:hypothetical protein
MELNAKLSSLEDDVKLLKGEVKLILSEIRTAILGQDNPFAEPGQGLRVNPGALDSRPPIRVVRVPPEDEESDDAAAWPEASEESLSEPEPSYEPAEPFDMDEPAPPPASIAEPEPEPAAPPEPQPVAAAPAPVAPPQLAAPVDDGHPRWSLLAIAGLTVWAEEAAKQIGSERLSILLDLCQFTGYLSEPAKEALIKVTQLVQSEERETPPTANEYLVVLCQLDALMKGDEPAGLNIRQWQQSA